MRGNTPIRREFCHQSGWTDVTEYVDLASTTDVKNRVAWNQLLEDARHKKVDLVIGWRMDQAFGSVLHADQTLENLKGWQVGIKSYQESWMDTTNPMGEMMYYITLAYAQLGKSLIAECVKAGMDRAQRQGKHVGRPNVEDNPMRAKKLRQAVQAVKSGQASWRQAAKQAGVALSTLQKAAKSS